jgi:hypothetical protein
LNVDIAQDPEAFALESLDRLDHSLVEGDSCERRCESAHGAALPTDPFIGNLNLCHSAVIDLFGDAPSAAAQWDISKDFRPRRSTVKSSRTVAA